MCQRIVRGGVQPYSLGPAIASCTLTTDNCSLDTALNTLGHWLVIPKSSQFAGISDHHCGLEAQMMGKILYLVLQG